LGIFTLVLTTLFATATAQAQSNITPPTPGGSGGEIPLDEVSEFLKNPSEYVYVVVELLDEPATQVYARERALHSESEAISTTQQQIRRIKNAQDRLSQH